VVLCSHAGNLYGHTHDDRCHRSYAPGQSYAWTPNGQKLLKDNARTDSFTGVIPPEGSNLWGWGKIDAQKAVLAAFNVEGIENYSNSYISLYPNPTTGVVYLKNDRSGEINSEIRVFNSLGINVVSQPITWKTNEACRLDLSGYSAGLYLVTFTTDFGENIYLKVVISK